MATKPDASARLDAAAHAELIAALNSRGVMVRGGQVKLQDVMEAAKKSIAAHPNTTPDNPGPLVSGVSERRFQEALTVVLAAINNNQPVAAGKPSA